MLVCYCQLLLQVLLLLLIGTCLIYPLVLSYVTFLSQDVRFSRVYQNRVEIVIKILRGQIKLN